MELKLEKFNESDIVKASYQLLNALELDLRDENFKDTPQRVGRMWAEVCLPKKSINSAVKQILSKTFPSTYSGMVTSQDIHVYSICGHHLLPIVLDVYIAYIPNKRVLGLSKMARLADVLAKQPMIQENYCDDIANNLMKVLKPKGVGVFVRGIHYCQTMRGAKQQNATMTTMTVLGCFRRDLKTREEFLRVIGK
jgi:GTP cyclohydrolase I